jgi:WD40 repeat protein
MRAAETVAIGVLAGEDVIVSGGWDRTVRVWSADSISSDARLDGQTGWLDVVTSGRLAGEDVIVSGDRQNRVHVWQADGTPQCAPLQGHTTDLVAAVAVGRLGDEDLIVSVGSCATVRVWSRNGVSHSRRLRVFPTPEMTDDRSAIRGVRRVGPVA